MSFSPVKAPGNIANQTIFGTGLGDTIDGFAGNDTIFGLAGDDALNGSIDNDTLYGGNGEDTLRGGDGNDTLNGGNHSDLLQGGDDNDLLQGGGAGDSLFGDNGNDTLKGGAGVDILNGGANNDWLDGGNGIDILSGGSGNDTYIIDVRAVDTVNEGVGQGFDTVHAYWGNFSLGTAGFENIEILHLKDAAGYVGQGNLLGNVIYGNEQSNTLSGFANTYHDANVDDGNDVLKGFEGQDILLGGTGNDSLEGGLNEDLLIGHAGNDTLVGGAGQDFLFGYEGNDRYVYTSVNQSRPGAGNQDQIGMVTTTIRTHPTGNVWVTVDPIYDQTVQADAFQSRQATDDGDKIDLSAIDSDPNTPGDQAFRFIGNDEFSGDSLGEVRVVQVGSSGVFQTQSVVMVNLGGASADTNPDMIINVHTENFTPLAAHDFIL